MGAATTAQQQEQMQPLSKMNLKTLRAYNYLRRVLSYNNINWIDPDKFHLTLKFLGNTHENIIPNITNVMRATVEAYSVINIELDKIGIFGSSYKPRVIWFGIAKNLQLEKLVTDLLNNLDTAGFPKDRQNYVPHISFGRINKVIDKKFFSDSIDVVNNTSLQKLSIDRVILYETILTNDGYQYNELFSMPLLAIN
jgi:2'-5' RNA ligase